MLITIIPTFILNCEHCSRFVKQKQINNSNINEWRKKKCHKIAADLQAPLDLLLSMLFYSNMSDIIIKVM